MPTIAEKPDSRSTERDAAGVLVGVTLQYLITGVSDDATAEGLVLGAAASSYRGLSRHRIRVTPEWADETTGEGHWQAEVEYRRPESVQPQVGEVEVEIDIGEEPFHITQSLSTAQAYAPSGETAPDFKGAINVGDDGVGGVDTTAPVMRVSVSVYRAAASVTSAYIATCYGLAAKTNSGPFTITEKKYVGGELTSGNSYTFAAGELRLTRVHKPSLSANGEMYVMGYEFHASPNATGLSVGPITGIDKLGQQLLWAHNVRVRDDAAKRIARRPIAAYVENIRYAADFSPLGLS